MLKNSHKNVNRLVVLAVLDGWGVAAPGKGNAVSLADTPFFDRALAEHKHCLLHASGHYVGLPDGVFGNSEVGHLNLGAGRIVYQDILRVNRAIADKSFFSNETFVSSMEKVKKNRGSLHIMGLLSDGRVHSSLDHLYAILKLAKQLKLKEVYIHAFLDGRDTPYNSGAKYLSILEKKIKEIGIGKIASVVGRFYAMDRDNHWERTAKAYHLLSERSGLLADNAIEEVKRQYLAGIFDEEMPPIYIIGKDAAIKDGDAVIFFNYRADRARQITKAFVCGKVDYDLKRQRKIKLSSFVSLTQYEKGLPISVAFAPEIVRNCLGEVISKHGLAQLRLAETEKYAHVTYFFNGGKEKPFRNEARIVVSSPRVESYASKPAMSAKIIAKKAISAIKSGKYNFILINFANADMVGHTGNISAAISGIETVDACVSQIYAALKKVGGSLIITADHGNADNMLDQKTGEIVKEHSFSPVPLIIADDNHRKENAGKDAAKNAYQEKLKGALSDVAPTVLDLLGIKKPEEMSGKSLS